MSRTRRWLLAATGVLGELLLTAGVLLFGFVAWQLWWTDVEGNRAQAEIVANLDWQEPPPVAPSPDATTVAPVGVAEHHEDPPVLTEPTAIGTTIATMRVPRWDGEPWRPISEGVTKADVLDKLGVGHYPDTAMPGGVGNFSVAGHRTTFGKPFNRIAELEVGDPVIVRTEDTWYVYRVTSTEIVLPSDVQVIAAVPGDPEAVATERMMTMTSCHPMFSGKQRYIVHLLLDYWAPVADGTPIELLEAS